MTTVVPYLIFQTYISYVHVGSPEAVQDIIAKYFSPSDSTSPVVKEIYERYDREFSKILTESYSRRYLA